MSCSSWTGVGGCRLKRTTIHTKLVKPTARTSLGLSAVGKSVLFSLYLKAQGKVHPVVSSLFRADTLRRGHVLAGPGATSTG